MIFIKNKIKRIFSLLACALIIVSALPISASAAVDGTFYFELYNSDTSWITDSDARSAFENIELYYLAPYGGEGGFEQHTFISDIEELSVAYGGDFDYSIKLVNNSYYEFQFGVTAFYVGSYGPFTIPAATSDGPGVFCYTIDSSILSNSEFQRLRFEFSSYQPVLKNPVDEVNSGSITFYAELPSGENVLLDQVRPPDTHVGAYSFVYADVMDCFELDDWQIEALSGYEINSSLFNVNTTYTIYDDTLDEIFIPYQVIDSSARTLRFELYDVNGAFLKSETVKVVPSALTCNTPLYGEFDVFPYSVDIDVSKSVDELQVFKCYAVNIYEIRKESYEQGRKDGLLVAQKDLQAQLDAKYDEGYDDGFDVGYEDGSEITGKERNEIMKDYNAITGFFDGMFNALFGGIDYVFNGVGLGGVTVGDVVWTLVVVAVVIIVGGKIF